MDEKQFAQLRLRAMAAAQMYGCEADIQEADDSLRDPRQAVVGLKVVVVRRSSSGELLSHEDNVRLPSERLAEDVATLVRDAAAKLPTR